MKIKELLTMQWHLFKHREGFTLAEVLITLGIIGVVAALTMPSLVQNHKNQETVARLQKAISVLNNGLRQMMADEEVDKFSELAVRTNCQTSVGNEGIACAHTYYSKYFNIVEAHSTYTSEDIYPYKSIVALNNYQNVLFSMLQSGFYGFITSDGIFYVPFGWTLSEGANSMVDVNGPKGPNKIGRDIFFLEHDDHVFKVYGADTWNDSSSEWDYCNEENGRGVGCAARILHDGWKIKY